MSIHSVNSGKRSVRCRWLLLAVLAGNLFQILAAEADAPDPIVVYSIEGLQEALTDDNAGRVIVLSSGSYQTEVPLVVPDKVTLMGEGVMLGGQVPTEFEPGSVTSIVAAPGFVGDLLTLGDGSAIIGLQLEQAAGFPAPGNIVTVASRHSGDSITVAIEDCELINPNSSGVGPLGPIGEGVLITTRNAFGPAPPAAHEDAQITLRMEHSVIRSSAGATGVFAINFGARGLITAELKHNYILGGLRVAGGVSRGDATSDAMVQIESVQNVYESPDSPVPTIGWQIYGGSSTPIPIPTGVASSNTVYVSSTDDRILGFTTSILGIGAQKFFDQPQQPLSNNLVDLRIRGLEMRTANTVGAADFRLVGANSDGEYTPGNGNVLRVLMRNSTGSGYADNLYANSFGPSLEENLGVDNRLEFVGSVNAFQTTNVAIDPLPGEEFFNGGN